MKVRKLWLFVKAKNVLIEKEAERYIYFKASNHWKSQKIKRVREQQSYLSL